MNKEIEKSQDLGETNEKGVSNGPTGVEEGLEGASSAGVELWLGSLPALGKKGVKGAGLQLGSSPASGKKGVKGVGLRFREFTGVRKQRIKGNLVKGFFIGN